MPSLHPPSNRSNLPSPMKTCFCLLLTASIALAAEKGDPYPIGYSDTPLIVPGGKWKVHDIDRPRPGPVAPGREPGAAPADATILFNGRDTSQLVGKDGV